MAIYLSLSRDHFAYGLKRKKTDKKIIPCLSCQNEPKNNREL